MQSSWSAFQQLPQREKAIIIAQIAIVTGLSTLALSTMLPTIAGVTFGTGIFGASGSFGTYGFLASFGFNASSIGAFGLQGVMGGKLATLGVGLTASLATKKSWQNLTSRLHKLKNKT